MKKVEFISHNSDETITIGKNIANILEPGDVILLIGDLGSGKTCLTQGIAKGMNVNDYVSSPSFVLIREYIGRLKIHHIDLYRVQNIDEIEALGIEEYIYGQDVSIIEWAEKGLQLFPEDNITVRLEYAGKSKRKFIMEFSGAKYEKRFEHWLNIMDIG